MNSLQVIEHNGERVLTTEQLAQAYECEPKQIKQNFNNNKSRFEEGKHYFKLDGDALRIFKDSLGRSKISTNLKFAPQLYLWTRRGASRHSKMLGTDKAWEMFDALEENYFNPRPKQLTPAEQMAQGLLAAQKLLADKEQRIHSLEAETERMKPKEIFADAVSASNSSILIGDLAKILHGNGIKIGRSRLFAWMREHGYLIKQKGTSYNMPTQRAMELKLFKVKEGSYVDGKGNNIITKTTKVTGKGQQYFINKFLGKG